MDSRGEVRWGDIFNNFLVIYMATSFRFTPESRHVNEEDRHYFRDAFVVCQIHNKQMNYLQMLVL